MFGIYFNILNSLKLFLNLLSHNELNLMEKIKSVYLYLIIIFEYLFQDVKFSKF